MPSTTRKTYASTLGAENRKSHERRLVVQDQAILDAGWEGKEKLDLIVEFLEIGRIRLHLASAIATKLATKRGELENENSTDRDELVAAFNLKYRAASLYLRSSMQLVLPSVVALSLGIPKGESGDLLLEIQDGAIDIMSVQYLTQRHLGFEDRISID
jgi:hypothetical protein